MSKNYSLPQDSTVGPYLFLLYINGITKVTNTKNNNKRSKFVLFSDDTIPIIISPNSTDVIKYINVQFTHINNNSKANSSLKLERSNLQFLTNKNLYIAISVSSDYNILSNITNINL